MKDGTWQGHCPRNRGFLRAQTEADIVAPVPMYSGERTSNAFRTFVRQLNQQFARYGVHADDRKISLARTRLAGRAAAWASRDAAAHTGPETEQEQETEPDSWSQFLIRLEDRFAPQSSAYRRVSKLNAIKMQPGQSVAAYGATFEARVRELGLHTCGDFRLNSYIRSLYVREVPVHLRTLIRRYERKNPAAFVRLRDVVDTVNGLEGELARRDTSCKGLSDDEVSSTGAHASQPAQQAASK